MTISIKSPTSTTGSIQKNGSDVLTFDSSDNVTVVNNLSVSGTVSSTGDINFDSNTLYVDATNNRVGIGQSSPSQKLDIVGNASVNRATATAYNLGGGIKFQVDGISYASIAQPTAQALAFYTGNDTTERMRITSSGELLMNGLYGGYDSNATGAITLNANAPDGTVNFKKGIVFSSDGGVAQSLWAHAGITSTGSSGFNGSLVFGTDGTGTQSSTITERMRINSNGNMLVGTTTEAANETRIVLSTNSGTTRWSVGPWSSVPTNFYITATSAAQGVYLGGTTATSWSGLSDERAKDIIEPIENAVEKVSTLRAVIGKYKSDNENNRKAFLIAQDVQSVLPEAVSVANPETGYLGLSYTDVIPLLVAAIKEQQETIKALETRIEALENPS